MRARPAAPGTRPSPSRSRSTGARTPAPGLDTSEQVVERDAAPLSNGVCGTFSGNWAAGHARRRRRHDRHDRQLLPLPHHDHRQRRQREPPTIAASADAKIDTDAPRRAPTLTLERASPRPTPAATRSTTTRRHEHRLVHRQRHRHRRRVRHQPRRLPDLCRPAGQAAGTATSPYTYHLHLANTERTPPATRPSPPPTTPV